MLSQQTVSEVHVYSKINRGITARQNELEFRVFKYTHLQVMCY